jgi:hypothetical protein
VVLRWGLHTHTHTLVAKLTIVLRGGSCRQQADDQQAEQRWYGGLAAALLLHFLLPHAERAAAAGRVTAGS